MLFHLRHDLRIGEFVTGLDIDGAPRRRLGSAETFLQLQLGLTRPEYEKGLGSPELADDVIVVPVKTLIVAFLVLLLPSTVLLAEE